MMTIPKQIFDSMARHSVMVNEGSGVLIQPACENYCYILTAKHVIEGKSIDQILISSTIDETITAIDVYKHSSLDAAIIKVEPVADLSISAYSDHQKIPQILRLRGFSGKVRAHGKSCLEQLTSYDLELKNAQEYYWEYRNLSFGPHDNIEGCSGGGVFYFDQQSTDCKVYIAGVEYEVADHSDGMEHQHLGCIPISVFNEIIAAKQLADLKPFHLLDFKPLSAGMFPRSYYQHIVQFEHAKFEPLLNWVKAHCNRNLVNFSTTPLQIISDFERQLSVDGRNSIELEDKACWEKFLEFLTLISIVNDKEFEELKPDELFNEFKVVYLRSSKPWTEHFSEVLTVDTSALAENGKILLFFNDVKGESAVIPKDLVDSCITNISGARTDFGAIDAAETIQKKGHTLIHWASLHDENIFSQREELKDLTGSEKGLVKVKELYSQYLEFQRAE
jgi:hypothetical protein